MQCVAIHHTLLPFTCGLMEITCTCQKLGCLSPCLADHMPGRPQQTRMLCFSCELNLSFIQFAMNLNTSLKTTKQKENPFHFRRARMCTLHMRMHGGLGIMLLLCKSNYWLTQFLQCKFRMTCRHAKSDLLSLVVLVPNMLLKLSPRSRHVFQLVFGPSTLIIIILSLFFSWVVSRYYCQGHVSREKYPQLLFLYVN